MSIELPVATRHRRDMIEKLLKVTLNPKTHTHTHTLTSEENDIHLLGISEIKLKSFHPDNAFIANNYQLFRKVPGT